MKIVSEIPYKTAVVQKLEGRVQQHDSCIEVGNIVLPEDISQKLQRRSQSYESLQDAIDDKEIYVHGRELDGKVYWFGLVSGDFKSMDPIFLDGHLQDKATDRVIRYDEILERVQIGYVIENNDNTTTMLHVDSGDFGVYGGNGESAVRVGISLSHNDPTVWTLFYNSQKNARSQRAIHKFNEKSVGVLLKEQFRFAQRVQENWEAVARRAYTPQELAEVAETYLHRQRAIVSKTLQYFPAGATGREFVGQLHTLAAGLEGYGRLKLEERMGRFVQQI